MESVIITYFKNNNKFKINDGTNHLIWETENSLFSFILSKGLFKVFRKKSELKIKVNQEQEYTLYAIGMFSISKKKISIKPPEVYRKSSIIGKMHDKALKSIILDIPKNIDINPKPIKDISYFKKIKLKPLNP